MTSSVSSTGASMRRRPAKALGQHFLLDVQVIDRILEAGDLKATDLVVEIGPGRGVLTAKLVHQAGRVVAVEVDPYLAETLPRQVGNPSNLQVVSDDGRSCDYRSLVPAGSSWKVLANLPYYAANPIVRRLLEEEPRPELLVVMVQQEVGQSMAAGPGKMNLLSLAVQFYGDASLVCTVPPSAFRPPPKVHSALVRIDVKPQPLLPAEEAPAFFKLAKAAFSAPRKQLHNALSRGLNITPAEGMQIVGEASLDPMRRPGTLALDEWVVLYRSWIGLGPLEA
jgi:16S rRNA (adenine1518-N6/adenine1519-N6)-dimethyltransferase